MYELPSRRARASLALLLAFAAAGEGIDAGERKSPEPIPLGAPEPYTPAWPAVEQAAAPPRWEIPPPYRDHSFGRADRPGVVTPGNARFDVSRPVVIDSRLTKPEVKSGTFVPGFFIVHFACDYDLPHKELLRRLLGPAGEHPAFQPNNAVVVEIETHRQLRTLRGHPDVDWVGRYQPAYKLDPEIGRWPLWDPRQQNDARLWLAAIAFPSVDDARLATDLVAAGAQELRLLRVEGRRGTRPLLLHFKAPSHRLRDLLFVEGIAYLYESARRPQLKTLSAAIKLQNRTLAQDDMAASPITTAADAPIWVARNLQGQGQLVGVLDSSLDWDNTGNSGCAFGYPTTTPDNWGFALPASPAYSICPGVQAGPNAKIPCTDILSGATLQSRTTGGNYFAHGVGVASSAVGDFYANDDTRWWEHDVDAWESWSPANYSGLLGPGSAHEAQLYFTPLENDNGQFKWTDPDFEPNLDATLRNMAAAGVSNVNFSYNYDFPGNIYSANSIVMDTVVYDTREILFHVAAGNEGDVGGTLDSMGNIKNGVTVTGSDDVLAPEDKLPWSQWGPTFDGRLKPDLIAPGDDSVDRGGFPSSLMVADSNGAGDGNCVYNYTAGTSYSAPLMAGFGALVHQYFEEGHYAGTPAITNPSGALMKAMLLNAGIKLTGANLGAPVEYPSIYQGWGEPKLTDILDFGDQARKLAAIDVPPADGFTGPGDTPDEWGIKVDDDTLPLKITLVWTDEPGPGGGGKQLINDLDLIVTAPGGAVYRGNVFDTVAGFSTSGGSADTLNNAESVHISSPALGVWTVGIDPGPGAYTVAQEYALVVTGAVARVEVAVSGATLTADSCSAGGVGDGNGIAEPGERIGLEVSIRNTGTTDAVDFTGTVVVNAGGILVSGGSIGPVTITAGATHPHPVVIDVTGLCGEVVDVDVVNMTYSGGSTAPDEPTLADTPIGLAGSEAASQDAPLSVRNGNDASTLSPAISYSPAEVDTATLSWTLTGDTDLVNCVQIELLDPDGVATIVKAAGAPDANPYDVTASYSKAGQYSIRLTELSGCSQNNRTAELDGALLLVDRTLQCIPCAGPPPEPSARDLFPAAPPLEVLAGDAIVVEKIPAATAYNVYMDPLGSWYSPTTAEGTACTVTSWTDNGDGTITLTVPVPPGRWIAVSASNSLGESSAGRQSGGTERMSVGTWESCALGP